MTSNELVELEGTTLLETDDAVLIDFGDNEPQWIPKSQMEDWPNNVGDNGEVLIQRWIAEEKGVI